jgi:phosphate ABC transporter phosphate-binding protein
MKLMFLGWLVGLLCTASVAAPAKPITVIIIGVPSNGVTAYADSPLGTEIVKACEKLNRLFTNDSVEVIELCDNEKTKSANVHSVLDKHFGGAERGHLTVVFVMAHGEVTDDKDVRLLLSDATDDAKDEHSLLLRVQLAARLANGSDSVSIAFVDACYSGNAGDLRLESLGNAAEEEGTHVGLLVSSQPDEKSYAVAFTNTLIDIWKSKKDCPHSSSELSSDLLSQMDTDANTPKWLINYHDSLCFNDLLNPNKRVISIWHDPDHHGSLQIQLFDGKDEKARPLRTIGQGTEFSNPYILALNPGYYRIEARGSLEGVRGKKSELLDKQFCDFSVEKYCEYYFPHSSLASADSLQLQEQVYRSAAAHGYSNDDLKAISDRAASAYAQLVKEDPTKARRQLTALRSSQSAMWDAMLSSQLLKSKRVELTASAQLSYDGALVKLFSTYENQNPAIGIKLAPQEKSPPKIIEDPNRAYGYNSYGWNQQCGRAGLPDCPTLPNPEDLRITEIRHDSGLGGGAVYIPIALNGIVPIYNLQNLKARLLFTPKILTNIYMGKINRWNDPAIVVVNPHAALPDKPITVLHRADESGATWIWTDYLSKVSIEWRKLVGSDSIVKWPIGVEAVGNEGVAAAMNAIEGSLGYADLGYARDNHLTYGAVKNYSGKFVIATDASIAAAAEGVTSASGERVFASITESGARDAYPISSVVWIVVPERSAEMSEHKVALDFVEWYFERKASTGAIWSPLSPTLHLLATRKLNQQIWTSGQIPTR